MTCFPALSHESLEARIKLSSHDETLFQVCSQESIPSLNHRYPNREMKGRLRLMLGLNWLSSERRYI
jgi:hypothetical protein